MVSPGTGAQWRHNVHTANSNLGTKVSGQTSVNFIVQKPEAWGHTQKHA